MLDMILLGVAVLLVTLIFIVLIITRINTYIEMKSIRETLEDIEKDLDKIWRK